MSDVEPFDLVGLDLTPEQGRRLRFNLPTFGELDAKDMRTFQRWYRALRIRVPYAAPGSPELDGSRHSGHSYGMTRDDARTFLWNVAVELDWHLYLGSK